MHRCPEYIIGVRITYFFELHNAIKSWTKYFNGQTIFLFCGNSLSFFVVNRFPICCTSLKKTDCSNHKERRTPMDAPLVNMNNQQSSVVIIQ